MNIFLSESCPISSAQALDDRRLVKMVLETAQLLSAAARMMGVENEALYKITHANHPCGKFARQSFANFSFLYIHGWALAREYHNRYGKTHASEAVIQAAWDGVLNLLDPKPRPYRLTKFFEGPFELSFNCSGFNSGDLYEDYKNCLRAKWDADTNPTWTKRGQPEWR
jgi:hypothetical protein